MAILHGCVVVYICSRCYAVVYCGLRAARAGLVRAGWVGLLHAGWMGLARAGWVGGAGA